MAGNARSRSRTRRPPLQPLHPPSGIAPPPRPRTPLRPPLRTKARSVGPVVPDINRQGPPYLMIHRSGTTAPKAPPELPPRHTPRFPKTHCELHQTLPRLTEVRTEPTKTYKSHQRILYQKKNSHTTTKDSTDNQSSLAESRSPSTTP